MSDSYDDIIDLPHPISRVHPQMSAKNRAAQFSPFAALTGYDAAIKETARLTDQRIELSEGMIEALEMKLNLLAEAIDEHPEITVTYYRPDAKKQGGAYRTIIGAVKKIDNYERVIVLMDGARIPMVDVLGVEGTLFEGLLS